MLFTYEAKDAGGHTVTGTLEASDERTAAGAVRDRGYYVMRLTPTAPPPPAVPPQNAYAAPLQQPPNPSMQTGYDQPITAATIGQQSMRYDGTASTFPGFAPRRMTTGRFLMEKLLLKIWSGVSLRDLAVFYRQFAALANAGVSTRGSLDAIGAQSSNPTLRRHAWEMRAVVEAGGQISDAMALFPWLFGEDCRALIMAGEISGHLQDSFTRLAESAEQEQSFRDKIRGAVLEPLFTLSMVFLLPPLFILIVLNSWTAYFNAAVLPLINIASVWLGIYILSKVVREFRSITDTISAHLPGIGMTVRLIALSRFCRTLASLFSGGVNVPQAVGIAANACGNEFLSARLMQSVPRMAAGHSMLEALQATRVLPPIVLSMLGVGEITGDVDVMMNKIAEHFEQETVVRLHSTAVTIRVLATLAVGVVVLMIVVNFYTGYFGGMMNMPSE